MLRAGIALAEHHFLAANHIDCDKAARQADGRLDGICQPASDLLVYRKAVYHNLHRVLFVLFQRDLLVQLVKLAVHTHARKTGAARCLKFLLLRSLAAAHHGRKHLNARFCGQAQHLVHHLIHRLLADHTPAHRAMRNADPRVHQAQIIVYLRHRAHRGARIARGGFLIDGDGGRKALDLVHIRLFHLPQKLPRVAGKALHIAPLPIRIDGIKCKRGFSAAGKPRHNDQLIARKRYIEVFQIIHPSAFDHDLIHITVSFSFLPACAAFRSGRAGRPRARIPVFWQLPSSRASAV